MKKFLLKKIAKKSLLQENYAWEDLNKEAQVEKIEEINEYVKAYSKKYKKQKIISLLYIAYR